MASLSTLMGQLRLIAFLEGVSYLVLLFVAYGIRMPDVIKILGPIHGFLFIAYVIYVFIAKSEFKWTWGKTLLALVLSIIPFGTFWAEWKLFR